MMLNELSTNSITYFTCLTNCSQVLAFEHMVKIVLSANVKLNNSDVSTVASKVQIPTIFFLF